MPNAKSWTADDMPDLTGKTVIVTGGNDDGIGYEAALQFARKKRARSSPAAASTKPMLRRRKS